MNYKYETHLHSSPVSSCAKATLESSLPMYKKRGYDGVFLTNHFPGGNFGGDDSLSPQEKIDFFCSGFFEGLKIARQVGIKLFFGVEMTYSHRTDFLVYGLTPEWYCEHPEILDMPYPQRLEYLRMHKAYIVQAHPFREKRDNAPFNLFPRAVDAVETINSCNYPDENKMATAYAAHYKLPVFAGTDNHLGPKQTAFAGIITREPINEMEDFIRILKNKQYRIFGKSKY